MNDAVTTLDPCWYGVRCQTKREHLAAEQLNQLDGVDVFCPRLRYRKATRRGKIWWVEPLFPGYVMARFDLKTMERAVAFCHGVRGLIRFGSLVPSIPDSFVKSLQKECSISNTSSASQWIVINPSVEIGDEVEVAHGPLRGLCGKVISMPSAVERVRILMDFLGQPQSIEIDLFALLLPRHREALANAAAAKL